MRDIPSVPRLFSSKKFWTKASKFLLGPKAVDQDTEELETHRDSVSAGRFDQSSDLTGQADRTGLRA